MDEDMQVFIGEWLKDSQYDVLNKASASNPDIVEAIFSLIEEWKSNKELINKLCLRFFGYYRTEFKWFTLQFLPSLIYSYLSAIAHGDRKDAGSMQTLLLAIYNLEAGAEAQNPKVYSFRIPNIAQPSIYHDTSALASASLTESALKRLDPSNRITAKFGPHPHLHSFNAENRLPALAALLRIYSNSLSLYSKSSLSETCMAFRRLVAQGYTHHSKDSPRIPLSSKLLVEMLQILYSLTPLPIANDTYVRLNTSSTAPATTSMEEGELGSAARQTLEAVQSRVEVELMAEPLLVSAALADSSHLSVKGVNGSPQLVSNGANDGATNRSKWKSMITNASFRTKKLPDDITVGQLTDSETNVAAPSPNPIPNVHLGSITEETTNDEPTVNKSFRLSELVKKKSKPKESKSKLKANNNGGLPSETPHSHSTSDNNGAVLNAVTAADWNSDVEDETELRRRSNELNGSTPV